MEELADLRAELRHFKGRPAVDGKPLELQTRDELLAVVHGLQAENDRLGFEANAGRQAEAEADDEAREMAEALEWYANPDNWKLEIGYKDGQPNSVLPNAYFTDKGERARNVLAKYAAQSKAGA